MTLRPWPYMKTEKGWTIPYQVMLAVWEKMVELDRVKSTFYDGFIKDAEDFLAFMQSPSIFPMLVVETDRVRLRAIAWLSDMTDGTAHAHFCYLDRYQQAVGELVLNEWSKIDSLRVIVGKTPKSYELTLKIIQRWGFRLVGEIPEICNLKYENRRDKGVISYYLTKGEEDGRR